LLLLLLASCSNNDSPSPIIQQEIENGNYASIIVNQDWSATIIGNFETGTFYEGYFIFHFYENGEFSIDAYDLNGNEMDYPVFGGEYKYSPGTDFVFVDYRKIGQGNPYWPKTDKWQIKTADAKLEGMPNPYKTVMLANNARLTTDLYPGNILKFKKIAN